VKHFVIYQNKYTINDPEIYFKSFKNRDEAVKWVNEMNSNGRRAYYLGWFMNEKSALKNYQKKTSRVLSSLD